MKKFIIADEMFEMFPDLQIGILVCEGISNEYDELNPESSYETKIRESEKTAKKHLTESVFSENQVVKCWREAFQKFKTKKGARCSIEALLKRIEKENHLGTINPLVDIYNIISLQYGIPCGGEDIDNIEGDILLTKAVGVESFITLGSDKSEPPYEGEVIYKDDEGAICRCWNWREGKRTMLTEDTKNAFMCLEQVDATRMFELKEALDILRQQIESKLGAKCRIEILNSEKKEIELA
ncbi:MAG: B3/4 domain-containing protein [Peptostreptococcaceae bacterium]|nr:B3/4 domain-containing protein [Peptostreptococcaceae bacterium]